MAMTGLRYFGRGVGVAAAAAVLLAFAPAYASGPYFQAGGGDVVAGARIATNAVTSCSGTTPSPRIAAAGIVSWNSDDPSFGGAGSEYAAFALDHIQDFVTGQGNGVPNGQAASDLAFANENIAGSLKPNQGLFGGMFGASPCADYWNNRPATSPVSGGTLDVGSLAGGAYLHNSGNLTLRAGAGNTMTISSGVQATLYVEGDVAIASNIIYNTGGWTNRSDIPSFRLIVDGTIYIDKDVTNLDGLYVATPGGPETSNNQFQSPYAGTISTCSRPAGGFYESYDPTKILTTSSSLAADCAKPLTVTGSVVAGQVWLLRNFGGLGSQPAEVFNYAPEVWLSPAAGSAGATPALDFQYIVGLPPTL